MIVLRVTNKFSFKEEEKNPKLCGKLVVYIQQMYTCVINVSLKIRQRYNVIKLDRVAPLIADPPPLKLNQQAKSTHSAKLP